jgi:glycosyltransferase involved in cell wall biosynthesis
MIDPPHPQQRKYLAAIGDVNSLRTWSGTAHHLLDAGRECGLINEGLRLRASGAGWALRRFVWNSTQVLKWRGYGGYQFQPCFLERLYAPVGRSLVGNVIINCFQLYPPSIVEDSRIQKWFYIDMTLRQRFTFYGALMEKDAEAAVIERERRGYHSAVAVITLSKWAAESLIADYGMPKERVHTVIPGANLDPAHYDAWNSDLVDLTSIERRPVRLVFVGREWKRKGLDTLLAAFQMARERGADLTLRIIGVDLRSIPRPYRTVEGVEVLGFLDKRKEGARFLTLVSECDIGCLLSRADASPIALREYVALGLVTLHTDAGGSPEMTDSGASFRVPVTATADEIADLLVRVSRDRVLLRSMRRLALDNRNNARWTVAAMQMAQLLDQNRNSVSRTNPRREDTQCTG